MNNFYTKSKNFTQMMFFTQTQIVYTLKKIWSKLDKARLIGKTRLQGKNNYRGGGIWYGLLLAPKSNYCLSIKK